MEEQSRYQALFYADSEVVAERTSASMSQLIANAAVFIEDDFPCAHCMIWDRSNNHLVHQVKRAPIE